MSGVQCVASPRCVATVFDFSSVTVTDDIAAGTDAENGHTADNHALTYKRPHIVYPHSTSHSRHTFTSITRPGFDITNLSLRLSPTDTHNKSTPHHRLSLHAPDSANSEFDIQPVYNADAGQRRPSVSAHRVSLSSLPTPSLHVQLPSTTRPHLFLRTTQSPIDSMLSKDDVNTDVVISPVCPPQPETHRHRQSKLTYFANDCTQLLPNLFVGSKTVANNLPLLLSKGITHIVNCCGGVCDNMFPDHFTYTKLYLLDNTNEDITCLLYPILAFIQTAVQSGGKVLVHCHQGVSRSCVLCIGYVMYFKNMDYDEAHTIVRSSRGICRPNVGFMCQLMSWRKRCTNQSSRPFCLYRIAPHCAQDRRIVAKWCDRVDSSSIDSRGVYVLTTHDTVIVWVGCMCKENEQLYMTHARQLIGALQRIEHVTQEVAIIHQSDELLALQHIIPYTGRALGIPDDSPTSSADVSVQSTPNHMRSQSLLLNDRLLDFTLTVPSDMPATSQCFHPTCSSVPSPYTCDLDFQCFARVSCFFWQIMGGSHMVVHANTAYDIDYDINSPPDSAVLGGVPYDILYNDMYNTTPAKQRRASDSYTAATTPSVHHSYELIVGSPSTKRKQRLPDQACTAEDYVLEAESPQWHSLPPLFTSAQHSRRTSARQSSRRSSVETNFYVASDSVDDEPSNLLRNKLMRITLNTDIGCGSPTVGYRKRLSGRHQFTPQQPVRITSNVSASPGTYSTDSETAAQTSWLYRMNGPQYERVELVDQPAMQIDGAYCLVNRERGSNDVFMHVWIGSAFRPAENDHRFRLSSPYRTSAMTDDVSQLIDNSPVNVSVDMQSIAQALAKQLSVRLRLDDMNNHITTEVVNDDIDPDQFVARVNSQTTSN